MNSSFSNRHPLVNFAFFTAVIGFSVFLMQPVALGISLVCALLNAAALNGRKTAALTLKFLLPMVVLITVTNPLFNHRGATILTYLPWDNPLTLESVLYGLASAGLICAVALWFSCVNRVMTSDKIIYLFGRIAPSLSMMLSMTLRFIPRFTAQFKQVREAQSAEADGKRSILARFKKGIGELSVVISWSMENAVETSDSMKSRGYGLKGRTAFSPYRFYRRDAVLLGVILTEAAALLAILLSGQLPFSYFPSVSGDLTGGFAIIFYIIYAALLMTPLLLNAWEGLKWKRLRSSI